jgi:serine/threonine protein kinase
MLERDVEGDREYLSPEALNGNAVLHVGTHSDVYSLGIMLLEAVGNVALPSSESLLAVEPPAPFQSSNLIR